MSCALICVLETCEGEDILGTLWKYIRPRFYGTLNEVKAEEIKNAFILNKSLTNSSNVISGATTNNTDAKIFIEWTKDAFVQQFLELYNKPEFQKMQQIMTSPSFQAAIEAAGKIQEHLNWTPKSSSTTKDTN